jgi:hypothetical protein
MFNTAADRSARTTAALVSVGMMLTSLNIGQ